MDYGNPMLADALAAQYVAGTLRGGARRRFEVLLPSHPALQRAVRDWQLRLLPLTGAIEEKAPPARVWRNIERRLWPALAPTPWWERLGIWRLVSAGALAALAGSVVLQTQTPPTPPPTVVVLQGTGADTRVAGTFVASLSGDGTAVVIRPIEAVVLVDQRVLELWSVPAAGKGGPTSLGLISASGTSVVPRDRLPKGLLTGGADLLAVSVEPPGGSTTGAPTGPVVFAGKLDI